MVGGRSEQVCNVPTDFLRGIRTEIGRYLVGIGNDGGAEVVLISAISAEIWRWIEIDQKCTSEVGNENCEKWSEEGQSKSATSPWTPYEDSGPISGDIWSALVMTVKAKSHHSD